MSLSDPKNTVVFASSLPVDKIVRTFTGTFPVNNNTTVAHPIDHNLNRKCFSELLWSIDGQRFYGAGQFLRIGTSSQGVTCVAGVGLNTAKIYADNFGTGNNYTITYRLVLIWPT